MADLKEQEATKKNAFKVSKDKLMNLKREKGQNFDTFISAFGEFEKKQQEIKSSKLETSEKKILEKQQELSRLEELLNFENKEVKELEEAHVEIL